MKTTLSRFFLYGTVALILHSNAKAQVVTTVATISGPPLSVLVGKNDTLYAASNITYGIKKIDPIATVSSFVGSGSSGLVDGTGAGASFSAILGMVRDSAYNIYATDYDNNSIRKITPAGVVITLATGLNRPIGIVWGKNDTLIVYNSFDGTIVKVAPTGTKDTFTTAAINCYGLAKGSNDTLYLSGYANNQIYKIDPNGTMTTLAGSGAVGSADGVGTTASFNLPNNIEIDGAGNLFITDTRNNKIRKVTAAGVVTTFAGSGLIASTDGTGSAASFNFPRGISMSPATGNFYITDYGTGAIRKMTGGVPLPLKFNKYDLAATELKVFPSPFTEVFTISSSKAQSAQLINNLGQVLLQIDIVAGEQQVSVAGQPAGLYYLKNENGSVQRIVKL